jgi:single-stranded-DNA-specific exonuclease
MQGFAAPALTPNDRYFLGVARSVTGRSWRARLDARGEAVATAMAQRDIASESLARVLAGRGVGLDDAESYLSPSLRQDLVDPSSLLDMDKAAARLADAVTGHELVAIFGDYDVDGATSAALLHGVLAALGDPPRIYIPDRIFEGYGPNPEAIDDLIDGGAKLIVCVDCGSTSFAALERAEARGVDVIVLDHHQVGAEMPPAVAIVNPNRGDDISGQGHLAAVGVAFLTAVALLRELRRRGFAGELPDLLTYLDLAAFGTVCDIVPLVGLNRALVAKGLIALRHTECVGMRALINAARLKSPPDSGHLGFVLGPRINAGGRIGEATLGATLLTTTDPAEAERIATLLDRLNAERQMIEAAAVGEAMAEAEAEIGEGEGPPLIVVSREGWHPGVVGLVAARLRERFRRPAFAIAWNVGDFGTGSGRSVPGVDLGAAVRAAVDKGLLVKGGGHAMAAGITLKRERLGDLRAFLEERLAADVHASKEAERTLEIDGALSAGGATPSLVEELERAGPYGNGNPAPVFAFPAHRVAFADRAGNGHLRVNLASGGGESLKAVAFRAADAPLGQAITAARGKPLHVAGTLMLDHWGGTAQAQLRILDAAEPDTRF